MVSIEIPDWAAWLTQIDYSALMHQLFWWLVLVTVLGMLFKIGTIHGIILGIKEARSPIWDLRGTVDKIEQLEPVLKRFNELEPLIKTLGENLPLLSEKVDSSNRKLTELQLDSEASRTDDIAEAPNVGLVPGDHPVDNWPQLREYWRRNTRRLEFVIENIPDGRTRLAIDRMSRTNYRAIVKRLEDGKFLSKAAANASLELIDLFNKYRPRSQIVASAVVDPLAIVDKQLDDGIVSHDRLVEPSNQPGGFYSPAPNKNSAAPTDIVAHQRR